MVASSPTKSKDFYLLPDSDDHDNIPQDPLNPLTDAKVEVGKLIYHDPAFATVVSHSVPKLGLVRRVITHVRDSTRMIQGIGEGGEGFGLKGETRGWLTQTSEHRMWMFNPSHHPRF